MCSFKIFLELIIIILHILSFPQSHTIPLHMQPKSAPALSEMHQKPEVLPNEPANKSSLISLRKKTNTKIF